MHTTIVIPVLVTVNGLAQTAFDVSMHVTTSPLFKVEDVKRSNTGSYTRAIDLPLI